MNGSNEKEFKTYKGKNVRISDKGWEAIRKYCFKVNIPMGSFMEEATIEKIKELKSKK